MLRLPVVVFVAAALTACAHSSTTSTAPAPATSSGDQHPCGVAGACTVDIVIPDDVVNQLQLTGIIFKVFDGCPRALGFRDIIAGTSPMIRDNVLSVKTNTSMRGAVPVVQSTSATMVVPRLSGRYATVAIYFRTEPGKYAVVDFSSDPEQSAKFGYMYNGRAIIDDNAADLQNRTAERRMCP